MPLCAFQTKEKPTVTWVDNRFIIQYLADAPDDAVKAYLYGLMQCQTGEGAQDWHQFAKALSMDVDRLKRAFSHWEEAGLCRVEAGEEPRIYYLPVKRRQKVNADDYPLRAFNQEMAALFAPQSLTPGDLRRIYDWMDVFGIAQNAIPLLIQYGRQRMKGAAGRTVTAQLNYIDKIARSWAEDGVLSVRKAEGWIKKQEISQAGIHQLMRAMGMHRSPTQAEWELFSGWLSMGFTVDGMIRALERLTGSYSPTFKRLGEVLSQLAAQGMFSEGEIKRDSRQAERTLSGAGAMMAALGVGNPSPTAGQRDAYQEFLNRGYSHEMILLAAEAARKEGRNTPAALRTVLERWSREGADSLQKAEEAEARYLEHLALAREILERMGLGRRPNPGEVMEISLQREEQGFETELLYLAAEQAQGAKYPWRLYLKILDGWQKAGIRTARAAREAGEKRNEPAHKGQPVNQALQYEQRSYAPGELDDLFEKL